MPVRARVVYQEYAVCPNPHRGVGIAESLLHRLDVDDWQHDVFGAELLPVSAWSCIGVHRYHPISLGPVHRLQIGPKAQIFPQDEHLQSDHLYDRIARFKEAAILRLAAILQA